MTVDNETASRKTAESLTTRDEVDRVLDEMTSAGLFHRNSGQIENYLLDHGHVLRVLPDIAQTARERLGPGTQVALELDTSSGPGNDYLIVLVRVPQYSTGVFDLARELTAAARQRMPIPEPYFLVTTDFAHPL